MTKPMGEPTSVSDIAQHGFRIRQLERRPQLAVAGKFELIAADDELVETGNGALWMMIPEDLDGTSLIHASAGVVTESDGGDIEVMVVNDTLGDDMLTDPVTITEGERSSYDSSPPPVIDTSTSQVTKGDWIRADVDSGGANALGLAVVLHYG